MKYLISVFIFLSLLLLISCEQTDEPLGLSTEDAVINSIQSTIPTPPSDVCARTPGYWKNHANKWPKSGLGVGGIYYSKEEIIKILNMPEAGDKSYTIFRALVAAELNVLNGAENICIDATIWKADGWLKINLLGSDVAGSSEAWKMGEPLYLELDDYNNGLLCAPECD